LADSPKSEEHRAGLGYGGPGNRDVFVPDFPHFDTSRERQNILQHYVQVCTFENIKMKIKN
jgi:hypothetical protein